VGQLVVVLTDEGGELLEVGAALGGVESGPCWEGGLCGGDGGVDVVFGGFGDCEARW